MKIVIPGGSGQVGAVVSRPFQADGHEVTILSRAAPRSTTDPPRPTCRVVHWDGVSLGDWANEIDGADVVLNLAGRSVNCRYTPTNRAAILDSRVRSTRVVGQAVAAAQRPPHTWLQASTATIYAHRYDAPNDEATGEIGGGEPDAPDTWRFSIAVARAWEAALNEASVSRTRKIALRSAMIMSPDRDGIFDTLLTLVRRRLGGRAADGRQYISWVHHRDFVRALYWLIDHPDVDGPVNIASPNPLPNVEFMRILRRAAGVSFGLPASRWMLEVGALFMGTETELILKSRRVVPGRLLEGGFRFEMADWEGAARELCGALVSG